jgi:hypothetical protein
MHCRGFALLSILRLDLGDRGTAPNIALEPTASSFGFATLRLRFRRRLTAGVRRLIFSLFPIRERYIMTACVLGERRDGLNLPAPPRNI